MPTAELYKGISYLFLGLIKTIPRSLLTNVDVSTASTFLLLANTLLQSLTVLLSKNYFTNEEECKKIYEKQRKFITADCYYAPGSENRSNTVNARSRMTIRFTDQCCQGRFCRVGGAFFVLASFWRESWRFFYPWNRQNFYNQF